VALGGWDKELAPREAAKLLSAALRGSVSIETGDALFEKFDRMSLDLALMELMLEGKVVARANVDRSRPGKSEFDAHLHGRATHPHATPPSPRDSAPVPARRAGG
jgi:hypothetical protein